MKDPKLSTNISRRDFLLVGGGGLTAVILASCTPAATPDEVAPGGDDVAPPAEPIAIEFLAWGDPADIEAWDKLKVAYEAANPNVTVNVTSVADSNNNFYPKLNTAIAGGVAPHVSSFQGWEWQAFADKGVLSEIDSYVAGDSYFEKIFPDNATINVSTKRKDKRYLIPMQLGTMVMFYSKPIFDRAGVDYPTDDWTLEDFLDIAEKLTDLSDPNAKSFGAQTNGSWFRDIHWIRSTGKQEFDEIVDPRKAQFNQPEIVEMLQLVASDMIYKMGVAPSAADTEGGAVAIEAGNVGMKYEGPWYFGRLDNPDLRAEGTAIDFDVVLMPQAADASRPHRGWAEGIALPNSDNVEAGWGFASYMASEEGDRVYAETTGRIPNNIELIESFWIPTIQERFGVENGQAFIESFNRSEVDVVGGIPRSKMWSEIVKPFGYDPLINNSATAAEVLPEVDQKLQELIDEFWANA